MWIIILAVFLAFINAVEAVTVTIHVDPNLVGPPISPASLIFPLDGLNGTPLEGQSLSFDLLFADSILARVYHSSGRFNPVLVLGTNAPLSCVSVPGFPQGPLCGNWPEGNPLWRGDPVTAFLLAPDGTPLDIPIAPVSGAGSDGSVRIAFLLEPTLFDISGIQLGFHAPTGLEVTEARLHLFATRIQFGTAAQLPESLSLLEMLLVGAGLVGLVGAHRYYCGVGESARPRRDAAVRGAS